MAVRAAIVSSTSSGGPAGQLIRMASVRPSSSAALICTRNIESWACSKVCSRRWRLYRNCLYEFGHAARELDVHQHATPGRGRAGLQAVAGAIGHRQAT